MYLIVSCVSYRNPMQWVHLKSNIVLKWIIKKKKRKKKKKNSNQSETLEHLICFSDLLHDNFDWLI
jgi:hypothetical protein